MVLDNQIMTNRLISTSVPDQHVYGPPGSGSISQRYGSGSGFFYQQAKIVRKTLIPTVLFFFTFYTIYKRHGSGSTPKCHGSGTLISTLFAQQHDATLTCPSWSALSNLTTTLNWKQSGVASGPSGFSVTLVRLNFRDTLNRTREALFRDILRRKREFGSGDTLGGKT
jgi:hypothetical protein